MFVLFRHGRLYLAVFSAVLGNFNFGFALVFPSPVIPQLQKGDDPRLQMDVHQISWFGVRSFMYIEDVFRYIQRIQNPV